MTTEQTPVIDVFIGRDHGGWRLYVAPESWCPLMLRRQLDQHLEAFPVAEPDLEGLDKHMWQCDAPYEKQEATAGVQIAARGRSATVLLVWLEELFA